MPPEGIDFKEVITDFEKRLIESTLEAAGGVQKRAAELLHIKPTTLNEMIKRYDIRPRRRRHPREGDEPVELTGRRETLTGRDGLWRGSARTCRARCPTDIAGGRTRGRCVRARRAVTRR